MSENEVRRQLKRLQRDAERAKESGDRERYWHARRAYLRFQAEHLDVLRGNR